MTNNNEKGDYNTGVSDGTKKFFKSSLTTVLWSKRSKKCLIKDLKNVLIKDLKSALIKDLKKYLNKGSNKMP